jgi:hypothetical protein
MKMETEAIPARGLECLEIIVNAAREDGYDEEWDMSLAIRICTAIEDHGALDSLAVLSKLGADVTDLDADVAMTIEGIRNR